MQAACGMMSQKLKALCAAIALAALSACAAPSSYMGIAFAPVAAANSGQSEIQSLARRAQAGDKHAQLELGIRFEEGRGVVRDLEKAKMLYQLAAKDTPIKHTSFIPEGGIIRAETTNAGVRKGLPEAKERLTALDGDLQSEVRNPPNISYMIAENALVERAKKLNDPKLIQYVGKGYALIELGPEIQSESFRFFLHESKNEKFEGLCEQLDKLVSRSLGGAMESCYYKQWHARFASEEVDPNLKYYTVDYSHSEIPDHCDVHMQECISQPFSLPWNDISGDDLIDAPCEFRAFHVFRDTNGQEIRIIHNIRQSEIDGTENPLAPLSDNKFSLDGARKLKGEKIRFCNKKMQVRADWSNHAGNP